MNVLPNIEIFEKFVSNQRDKTFSDVNSILYNSNNCFLLTSNYLNLLESKIEDFELIKSLVVQLSDENRITENSIDNSDDNIVEKLYQDNSLKTNCLFAITLNERPSNDFYCYGTINSITKNKDFIIFELLKNNQLTFHYFDFNNNDEIESLLKKVFQLPKKLDTVRIYNRYSEYNHLTFLRNKSIHYYNLIRGSINQKRIEFINIENDLKTNLSRNLVLKTTSDLTVIHERKIFFNFFIISFDQALNNLLISEPNWKIDIQVDKLQCFMEWSKKNKYFTRLV